MGLFGVPAGMNNGQLGLGDNNDRSTLVEVTSDVKSVSIGYQHTLILKNDDTLWTTGWNEYEQLGVGDNNDRNTLVKIMDDVEDCSAGFVHSLILKNDGTLWAMGNNNCGQLGTGDTNSTNIPTQIFLP